MRGRKFAGRHATAVHHEIHEGGGKRNQSLVLPVDGVGCQVPHMRGLASGVIAGASPLLRGGCSVRRGTPGPTARGWVGGPPPLVCWFRGRVGGERGVGLLADGVVRAVSSLRS